MSKSNEILIGCHISMAAPDYLKGSVLTAHSYGCNAFMIYTGAPQNFKRKSLKKLKIPEFQQLLKEFNIKNEHVVVHCPYIMNVAAQDPTKQAFSYSVLEQEVIRTEAIGCKYMIMHPGNATDTDRETAMKNIAKAINKINLKNKNVVICLETMAGKGTEVGINFDEIAKMISMIENKSLIGVCLDTCHINDYGYDVSEFDQVLDEFDQKIGLDYLKVIHLNDTMNPRYARKDRHQNIGYGHLGFKVLNKVVHNQRIAHVPKILETPYYGKFPIYKQEIEMFRKQEWYDVKNQIDREQAGLEVKKEGLFE